MRDKPTNNSNQQSLIAQKGEIEAITNNLQATTTLLASLSFPSTNSLGDLLEKVAVNCAELHTLNTLIASDLQACSAAKSAIESINSSNLLIRRKPLLLVSKICAHQRKSLPSERKEMLPKKINAVQSDSSDDEAPVEVTSKAPDIQLAEAPKSELSLYEQVQLKKKKEEVKREKTLRKSHRIQKLRDGEYEVKTKNASFKLLTADKGVKGVLKNQRDFRAELLEARVGNRRRDASTAKAIAKARKL
ncbi:unnamed protein product, partial [Mesorhabditis belari]|uniref:Uncharacterized protein n=1 Tax=Mesorhabditis belari TaxID=2138241 RepID=A0AAF3EN96_9BILA